METIMNKFSKSRRAIARNNANMVETARTARAGITGEAVRYMSFVRREARSWRSFAAAESSRVARSARQAVTPIGLRRGFLVQLARALDALQATVSTRLERLNDGAVALPLDDYEAKTARTIVAEVAGLDGATCRRVYDFEGSHKRRATIMRAIEQRLAA